MRRTAAILALTLIARSAAAQGWDMRAALHENEPTSPERKLLDDVVKRVRLWRDVEPFYPDQLNGLPKTSESRGTEAVLNALLLATHDPLPSRCNRHAISHPRRLLRGLPPSARLRASDQR